MKQADVVIVGGSAAGIAAGITVKRHNKEASVLLLRREQKVPVPCGIPYVFGTLGSIDKNLIPDTPLLNTGIEIVIREATSVDRASKVLTTSEGETIGYGKLILATGSDPISPPLPGKELVNVFSVPKSADYIAEMQLALDEAKDIVIIGGGFIGVEVADESNKIGGKNVTIIEVQPHCLPMALDEDLCIQAESILTDRGIRIVTGNRVCSIQGNGKVAAVELQSGEKLKADVVIVAIGTASNTELARKMNLNIGEQGGIWVDEYMRTSDENIFAIGDCAEKRCFFTQKASGVRLGSIATAEARIAGANSFGLKRKNEGTISVFATVVGNLAFAAAGLTEKAAREAGFDIVVGEASAPDKHPGSMPSTTELKGKLIFAKDSGVLLGGQVVGGTSTGEMANVIAVLISNRRTADQVATLQMGTHPVLTASPVSYQLVNAAEMALCQM